MPTEPSKLKYINLKTTKKAKKLLKMVAALTEEHQYQVLERVLEKELKQYTEKAI